MQFLSKAATHRMRAWTCTGLIVPLLSTCVPAQKQPPQPAKSQGQSNSGKTPKLTEQQQRGVKLLESAESEAGGMTPETRAYVLWQVAAGYEQIGRRDAAIPLLKRAFEATLTNECQGDAIVSTPACVARDNLQGHILRRLLNLSLPITADLLPEAGPSIQQELSGAIISDYIRRKDFLHARGVIDELGRQGTFPYQSAIDFIAVLPEERSAEKAQVFAEALNAFKQSGPPQHPWLVDFGTMVARFWQTMPRALVVEAIDSLLGQAKDLDQNSETKREIVLSTTRGNVSFISNYQYRLFRMLPILQQIDPERADSILREQQRVKAALQQYPNGLQSPDSLGDGQSHTDRARIMSMSLIDPNASDAGTREARLQVQQELQTKVMQVESTARDDGEKALEDALRLPVWASERHRSSPRAEALLQVARITLKRQPNVSSHAIEKLQQLLAELPGDTTSWLVDKGDYLRWAAQVYRGLRDDDKAFSALKQGFKTADELEARDADPDDPNLALRMQWPSTLMRIQLFQAASEISPRAAEEMLQDTSDPDERIIQKVALGRSLLGSYTPPFDAVDWRKAGLQFAFETPN